MGSSVDKAEEKELLKTDPTEKIKTDLENIRKGETSNDFYPSTFEPVPSNNFPKVFQGGIKLSSKKAPMGKLLKQFPLALEAVAKRSGYGHEKYKDTDHDWMNFKRVPHAISEYEDAIVRHLAEIGEPEETSLDHLTAAAWNVLAKLQLVLERDKLQKTEFNDRK